MAIRSPAGSAARRSLFGIVLFVAAATVVSGCSTVTGSGTNNCESAPIPQFGLHGLVYMRTSGFGEPVAATDIGDVIESINDSSLPAAAMRCGRYTVADGQGALPLGTKIYSIRGIDPAMALAVPQGASYIRFEQRLPPPPPTP